MSHWETATVGFEMFSKGLCVKGLVVIYWEVVETSRHSERFYVIRGMPSRRIVEPHFFLFLFHMLAMKWVVLLLCMCYDVLPSPLYQRPKSNGLQTCIDWHFQNCEPKQPFLSVSWKSQVFVKVTKADLHSDLDVRIFLHFIDPIPCTGWFIE
jgi:hypothetical protein